MSTTDLSYISQVMNEFEKIEAVGENDDQDSKAAGLGGDPRPLPLPNLDDLDFDFGDIPRLSEGPVENPNPALSTPPFPVEDDLFGPPRLSPDNANAPRPVRRISPNMINAGVSPGLQHPPLVPASILGLGGPENAGGPRSLTDMLVGLRPRYRRGRVLPEAKMLKRFKATKVKKKEIKMLHYIAKDWDSAAYQDDAEFEKKAKRACQRCERLGKRCRVRKYGSFPCRDCIIYNISHPGSCCAMPVQKIKVKCTPVAGSAGAKVKTCFVNVVPSIEGVDDDALRCPKLLGNVEYKCEIVERKERKHHHKQGRRTFALTKCSQYYPKDKCDEQVDQGCVWSSAWCRLQGGPLKNLPSRPSRVRRQSSDTPQVQDPSPIAPVVSDANPEGPVQPVLVTDEPQPKRARIDAPPDDSEMSMDFLRSQGFDVSMFDEAKVMAAPPPAVPNPSPGAQIEGFAVDQLPEDKNARLPGSQPLEPPKENDNPAGEGDFLSEFPLDERLLNLFGDDMPNRGPADNNPDDSYELFVQHLKEQDARNE